MRTDRTYTLEEVLTLGFEARCIAGDGCRYLWHRGLGLRVEPGTGRTVVVYDPSRLPDAGWSPTRLGLEELAGDEGDEPVGGARGSRRCQPVTGYMCS